MKVWLGVQKRLNCFAMHARNGQTLGRFCCNNYTAQIPDDVGARRNDQFACNFGFDRHDWAPPEQQVNAPMHASFTPEVEPKVAFATQRRA